jgi:HSP20 family protein
MLMPSIFGNDFMNDFFGGFPYKSNGTMQTDVSETDKGYKVTMNLPGYQKEDIKGEVKDGYLTVTATTSKNNDEKDKDGKYIRKERYSGSCSRKMRKRKNPDVISAGSVTQVPAAEAFMSAMQ